LTSLTTFAGDNEMNEMSKKRCS